MFRARILQAQTSERRKPARPGSLRVIALEWKLGSGSDDRLHVGKALSGPKYPDCLAVFALGRELGG